MKVWLAYGEDGLDVELPEHSIVLEPHAAPGIGDAERRVAEALDSPTGAAPLRDLVRAGQRVAIVVSDITRPVPNPVLLRPILNTLHEMGVAREQVVIIVGTGMHRASSPDEVERMLGSEIAGTYEIVNHDARDDSALEPMTTTTRGVEVGINALYLNADVRILTGFVEPHIFAGYSGGGKAVLPGVAGASIVMSNHSAEMLSHPRSTWCVAEGNPVFEEMRDIALLTKPTFCVNVTLNAAREVTGIFAGEMKAAHDEGIAQAERQYVTEIDEPFDIVVSTNMGYPADLNLYQAVKGMSVAAQAVHEGGAIVLAAECRDGLGLEEYTELLTSEASPAALLERINEPGFARYDQWGVQLQVMVQTKADVWLHSNMSRETTELAHLNYCEDVSTTVNALADGFREANGQEPRIAVLPHGHLTVPQLRL